MASPCRYRKKPVEIEAMQLTEGSARDVFDWVVMHIDGDNAMSVRRSPNGLLIDTLEGTMRADIGDWVLRGVQGEFYPCKPSIFEATYEQVDDDG